ncbi:hypothetical protein KUV62_15715 [Salipiger bermudensis]|uniref:hypothetical protein n=1 Tax=Salipiger bermudensis TaxID=344736 RepID=UPI001C994F32|nr:hypothetical protein [Salipiger bermudensis]MBY6005372.1 hypothetical protein [Salipiger bermudensis]
MANVFDLGGSVGRGMQLGQNMQAIRQQNSLADLYRTEGAGIASGDPNALAKLAQIDPMAAFDMRRQSAADARAQQQFDMGMQVDRAQLDELKARGKRAAEEHAAKMTEYQRAQEAQGIRQSLSQAAVAYRQGPDAFGQFVQQNAQAIQGAGIDPSQVTYETFPVIAAGLTGAAEAFEMAETLVPGPAKPADEYGRYVAEEEAAGRTPMSRIDYKRAGQKTTRTSVGPDGSVTIDESFGGGAPELNVEQGKNTGFYIRMQDSNEILDQFDSQGLDFWQGMAGNLPGGLGNFVRTPEYQKFDQARRDFINALLRRESGAVISVEEFANAEQQYFPVPGDSPDVMEQKRRNRINAIEGIKLGSGGGADYVDQRETQGGDSGQPEKPTIEIPDFGGMTDEELDAWIAENGQ